MYKATHETTDHQEDKHPWWESVEKILQERHWLELAEYGSLGVSAIGSIAALVSQQAFYASAPMTLALALNVANRSRWQQGIKTNNMSAISQVEQKLLENTSKISALPTGNRVESSALNVDMTEVQQAIAEGRETSISAVVEVRQKLSREIENLRVQVQTMHLSKQVDLSGVDNSLNQLNQAIAKLKRENRQTIVPYLIRMGKAMQKLQQQQKDSQESNATMQEAIKQLRSEIEALNHQRLAVVEMQTNENPVPIATQIEESVKNWAQEITQQLSKIKPYDYQLVMDRDRARSLLIEALETAREQVIIVSPWLKMRSLKQDDLMQKIENALKRGVRIRIGWGYSSDIGLEDDPNKLITINNKQWFYHKIRDEAQRYGGLSELMQLKQNYPQLLSLKLLGTNENFVACDRSFSMLGTHNLLGTSADIFQPEIGLYTTEPRIIDELIFSFEKAKLEAR